MSYTGLLTHRCNIRESYTHQQDGLTETGYRTVRENVRCLLDLNFIRRGKDPIWTPQAGRPSDRTGVWFGPPGLAVTSGQWIEMVVGPPGTFQIEGAVDEAWRPSGRKRPHHLEIGVKEIPRAIARGQIPTDDHAGEPTEENP